MISSFKPYYKWNTFNTQGYYFGYSKDESFKPYYKWNTFNTCGIRKWFKKFYVVLNLIINGIPSILAKRLFSKRFSKKVLNLIINGIPSILCNTWN